MRKIFLFIVIFIFSAGFVNAQATTVAKEMRTQELNNMDSKLREQLGNDSKGVLIRHIAISGFVLKDTRKLQKLLKSKQNKHLSQEEIDRIIEDVKTIYLEAGYMGLVQINHAILKDKLIISVLFLSR